MEDRLAKPIVFTRASVASAPTPRGGSRNEYRDSTEPGLYLYVTAADTRTFFLYKKVKGQSSPYRKKIGRFPEITVSQAKRKAQELKAKIALGQLEVVAPISREEPTLAELGQKFFDVRQLRPKTVEIYRQGLEKLKAWEDWRIGAITKERIIGKHRQIAGTSGDSMADSTMRTLRALFEFYREQQDATFENPVKTLTANKLWKTGAKTRRKRHIPLRELSKWIGFFNRLEHETWRDYILFVLATGLRKEEVACLKWETVFLQERKFYIPGEETKNGGEFWLPLNSITEEILVRRKKHATRKWVFPSVTDPSKSLYPQAIWRHLNRRFKIELSTHDLRRTFSTCAESLDISKMTIKRLMNHKSGGDVTEGYIIPDVERLREASEKVSTLIREAFP